MAMEDNKGRKNPEFQYECDPSENEKVQVRMPDGRCKETIIPIPANSEAGSPREERLGSAAVTVRDEINRLLRDDNIPEDKLNDYEMVIVGPQGAHKVMDENSHISTYRGEMCTGRDLHLEIRPKTNQSREARPSQPDQFGYQLK